ncbi:hydroxymethylbilane synthase [Terrarubrum flagellatum]|uniref:hydroxymethylbilane synthase n=1 Tax=Terrirubrum flagellatum TaxID=2895980 RepID=UPI003145033D
MSTPFLTLGTRGSPLALKQAYETRARLAAAHGVAEEAIAVTPIRTTGDAIRDRALSEAGGKGLFTKELDAALLSGAIDIAVHSAKDVPTFLEPGVVIAGYLPRVDVRDGLIAAPGATLATLRPGARIGTASIRRQAQLKRFRSDFEIGLLRGNVDTRIRKVEEGEFDATLLAMAGLTRLGQVDRVAEILPLEGFLPAVGQGAIAIASRAQDARITALLAAIIDLDTGLALAAERAFLTRLDGSCRTPIGGLATIHNGIVTFRGEALLPDGSDGATVAIEGPVARAAELGDEAGKDLLARAPAGVVGR